MPTERQRRLPQWEPKPRRAMILAIDAKDGKPEPLIECLRSEEILELPRKELSEYLNWTAWLITKKVKARHRPRGSVTLLNFATLCAAYLLRIAKREWCRRHDCRNMPPRAATEVERWTAHAIELIEQLEDFQSLRRSIDPDKVKDEARLRPTEQILEYLHEDYEGRAAMGAMREFAAS
jgi:hypothetical protein